MFGHRWCITTVLPLAVVVEGGLVRNRVSLTLSCLNHFWLKPYRFPVSRDRIAESESALALPRPSRHFPSRGQACKTTKNPLIKLAPLPGTQNSDFTTDESNSFEHQEAGTMENNDRTLKELATLDVVYQPWCIQCPPLEPAQSYELKSIMIHLLPKFHGLVGEDPHKHLKEFHVVRSTMRP
ncbi:hypothetical protein CR513_34466, partial [Mucuna pruriens]